MPRAFRSMSGQLMELTAEDHALCIIGDLPARTMFNADGQAVIGCESAVEILNALREEGFVITRTDRPATVSKVMDGNV